MRLRSRHTPRARPSGNPWDTYAMVSPDARLAAVTDQSTGELIVRIDDLATRREVRRLPEKAGIYIGAGPEA